MSIIQEVLIYPALTGDAAQLLDVQKIAFQVEAEIYGRSDLPPLTQSLESYINEFGNYYCLKAVYKGQIIGSVRARIKNNTCFIGRLVVLPQFHKMGVGSKLMEKLEREFIDIPRFELYTGKKSLDNIRFYSKRGYTIFNKFFEEGNIELVNMEKLNI